MAKVLDVQMQGDNPCIWALIPDIDAPKIFRRFKIYGTGHNILEAQDRLDYVGTFQMDPGLVFHLFEVG